MERPASSSGWMPSVGAVLQLPEYESIGSPGLTGPQFSPTGLTLDAAGAAYISGAGSFASTPGALPTVANAGWILKLDASGKIVFGTGFMGGRMVLDNQGFIYIAGANNSDFALPRLLAPFRRQSRRGSKAFVAATPSSAFPARTNTSPSSTLRQANSFMRPGSAAQTERCQPRWRWTARHRNGGRRHGIQRLSSHAGRLSNDQLHNASSQRHHFSLRRSAVQLAGYRLRDKTELHGSGPGFLHIRGRLLRGLDQLNGYRFRRADLPGRCCRVAGSSRTIRGSGCLPSKLCVSAGFCDAPERGWQFPDRDATGLRLDSRSGGPRRPR